MADRQELGEVGAYLLFTGFTILVFPVAGPYILYKNWNGYAERLSWIPGVSSTGGKLSGFAAFVYVFVGIAVVGSAAVGVSGAGLVPAVEAQPGGGGTGSGGGATTLTPAPVGTSTENLVDVDTATPSGPSEAELRAERQRYEQFGGALTESASQEGVSASVESADASADTLVIQFEVSNAEDTEAVRANQRVLLSVYAEFIGSLESSDPEFELTSIPGSVELVTVEDGEAVSRGEVLFAWAFDYSSGNIDQAEYERRFFSEVEEA